jgi:hypothetical protein
MIVQLLRRPAKAQITYVTNEGTMNIPAHFVGTLYNGFRNGTSLARISEYE